MTIQSSDSNAKLKELDKAIKAAHKIEKRKEDAATKAEQALEEAQKNTYRLRYERDHLYLSSLGEKIDWGMVFNFNPDETNLAYQYRNSVMRHHNITGSGSYNHVTNQHIFCIEFETDSKQELNEVVKVADFIFSNLLPNPEDQNRKSITINNLIEEDAGDYDCFELICDSVTGQYSQVVRCFGEIVSKKDFATLEAALTHIQASSKVAFDTTEYATNLVEVKYTE